MSLRVFRAVFLMVLLAGLMAGAYTVAAARTARTARTAAPARQPSVRRPMAQPPTPPAVIAGRVASVQGTTATVATSDHPVCPAPATPAAGVVARCNAIVAGVSFQVDMTHAIFETAAGTPVQGARARLAIGDSVVVVGARSSTGSATTGSTRPLLRATVIQREASCAGR